MQSDAFPGGLSLVKLILTPLLSGQTLHPDVIRGVSVQSVQSPWLVHTATAYIDHVPREVNINANRQALQQLARAHKLDYQDFVLLLDSDVVMPHGAIQDMREALDADPLLACAAIHTKPREGSHVVTACALIRWLHYELICFWDNPSVCQCRKISKLGRTEYIDVYAKEIERTT